MGTLKHVFLDLDGTLTDPAPGIVASYQHAIEQLGLTGWDAQSLRRFIGPPLREAFARILKIEEPARIEQAVALYREYFAVSGLLQNGVIEGIPTALAELVDRGYMLHVATSKPKPFADRIVAGFDLAKHLRGVYGASMGGGRSDKAELLAHALSQVEAHPAEAVMVGDRKHDIRGARARGMASVGVLWGYGELQELAAERPNRIVIDVVDLPDVISELDASLQ